MAASCRNSPVSAIVNWPTLELPAATSTVSQGGNSASRPSSDHRHSHSLTAPGDAEGCASYYGAKMPSLVDTKLQKLGNQLSGRLSMPGDDGYVAATAIWAKLSGAMPRAVVHCRTVRDVNQPFALCVIATFHYQCVAVATTGLVARSATGSLLT